jgi:hypothetical protein
MAMMRVIAFSSRSMNTSGVLSRTTLAEVLKNVKGLHSFAGVNFELSSYPNLEIPRTLFCEI